MGFLEIGAILGISDSRALQIHDKAMSKIRRAIRDSPELIALFAAELGLSDKETAIAIEESHGKRFPPIQSVGRESTEKSRVNHPTYTVY